MTLSRFLQRLIGGDDASGGGAASLRNVAVWLFIALVALFLTQPSGGPFSAPGMQVPWPAELGLDGGAFVPEQGGGAAPPHRAGQPALAFSALPRIVSSVAFGVIRLPS